MNINSIDNNKLFYLRGDNPIIRCIRGSIFPDNINKENIMICKESIYSCTHDYAAIETCNIISRVLGGNTKNCVITEACAHVGGNTARFAQKFARVQCVEINKQYCDALRNNMAVCGVDNYEIINCDYNETANKLTQDVLFIDAPWGGISYYKKNNISLMLGDRNIIDIINDLHVKPLVVIKAPANFNRAELNKRINYKCRITYTQLSKHLIICIKNNSAAN